MVETVTFAPATTGSEVPPAVQEPAAPANLEKALSDTKAELTRVQQELAALKKAPEAPAQEPPPAAPETPATPEGAAAQEPPPVEPPKQTEEQKAAEDAVKAAGLDVASYQDEFDTTGDVSPESREKLAEGLKGLFGDQARTVVDKFIDGQKAALAARTTELFSAGGGEAGYKEMVAWAKTALTPAEIAQFDSTITSGDHNAALFAIKGLRSRFEGANGHEPQLLNAGQPISTKSGFGSVYEMTKAMADPRYSSDPAYRAEVEQRVFKSSF